MDIPFSLEQGYPARLCAIALIQEKKSCSKWTFILPTHSRNPSSSAPHLQNHPIFQPLLALIFTIFSIVPSVKLCHHTHQTTIFHNHLRFNSVFKSPELFTC